jgi:hypothetical protein
VGDPREGPRMHVPIVQGQFNYSSSCTVVVKISFFVYSGGGGGGKKIVCLYGYVCSLRPGLRLFIFLKGLSHQFGMN